MPRFGFLLSPFHLSTGKRHLRQTEHFNAVPASERCLIQPGPTGLHPFGARRVRSCLNRLQAFSGVGLTTGKSCSHAISDFRSEFGKKCDTLPTMTR